MEAWKIRVLFIGTNWYGSNARSCSEGLRRLGCDVSDIDEANFFPQLRRFSSRAFRRLVMFRLVEEFNDAILRAAKSFRPDIFIAFKGSFIRADTLRKLRDNGISVYNYYPDTSAFTHGKWLPQSLPEYDCVFFTKPFGYADVTKKITLKAGYFLPHGYDPIAHRPVRLSDTDIAEYRSDVSFIAIHSQYKEEWLRSLVIFARNFSFASGGMAG